VVAAATLTCVDFLSYFAAYGAPKDSKTNKLAAEADKANSNQIQFFSNPTAALGAFSFVSGQENGSRDVLYGPHFSNVDLGVAKTFPLVGERYHLQFRADAFNVFNHPNLQFAKSGPQNSIDTTTFGTPQFGFLTAARDPRQVQLALKLSF